MNSRGSIVVFCDADFSMPVEQVTTLRHRVMGHADFPSGTRAGTTRFRFRAA